MHLTILITFFFAFIFFNQPVSADEDFYGIIESRPAGKVGKWVIGGRTINVTEEAELDEKNGPLQIGACAEVDFDDGIIEEIESEPLKKCKNR